MPHGTQPGTPCAYASATDGVPHRCASSASESTRPIFSTSSAAASSPSPPSMASPDSAVGSCIGSGFVATQSALLLLAPSTLSSLMSRADKSRTPRCGSSQAREVTTATKMAGSDATTNGARQPSSGPSTPPGSVPCPCRCR